MKHLVGEKLQKAIYNTISMAEKELIIVSPYIQLSKDLKEKIFKVHPNNSSLHIIILFGKNENDMEKSFKKEDIEFFLKFPNITIVYIPELHGKYYYNGEQSISTSMNLIEYSLKNNIEFGVLSKRNFLKDIVYKNNFFNSSKKDILNIIEKEGKTIFVKRPNYRKKYFGLLKDLVGFTIHLNLFEEIWNGKGLKDLKKINYTSFPKENYVNKSNEIEIISKKKKGHCIRCNTEILFNKYMPLCKRCFYQWNENKNPDHIESYCHCCGKKKTNISKSTPLCYDCILENI